MWLNWQCSSSLLDTNQIALKLCISDNRWRLNLQFTLLCGALFIQFLELLMKNFCARSGFFFEFGASDGLIWSEISQGFQGYSNFVCRTKIDGVIDKKPDFIFDSFLTTAVFTQNKTVAKTLWLKILNFCPKIMIHFCHLNQWNSDSNSFKLYPNIRFCHLQPLNDFYCNIKLYFLIILDEKKDS